VAGVRVGIWNVEPRPRSMMVAIDRFFVPVNNTHHSSSYYSFFFLSSDDDLLLFLRKEVRRTT
jgi:hypothetical protein